MAPHGIYPCAGEDEWLAIACRDDADWSALARVIDEPWMDEPRLATVAGRKAAEDYLDGALARWTHTREKFAAAASLRAAGVPSAAVQRPGERVDQDPNTAGWGLWPTVHHAAMGDVRVDGLPVHFSQTDWALTRGGPCLGEDNDHVYGDLLGLTPSEIAALREGGVI
jgi:crotonobetainyl-CoA:carnitine CoA-transferase CaiB-like acyl-CoA transferase